MALEIFEPTKYIKQSFICLIQILDIAMFDINFEV